jgi:hypothetical protein
MKTTIWAMFGSLLVNVMLGLLIAAVFSVAPVAQATEAGGAHCPHAKQVPVRAPVRVHRGYLVEARMGWGPAG